MSKYSKKSSTGSGHPYMNIYRWANGEPQYWNSGPTSHLYSVETKAKLDARLSKMIDYTKNLSSFDPLK